MRFVGGLRDHGDRLAVVAEHEQLSYAELADRVDEMARELGPERRLVLVEAANDLAALVGYLGALRGGHVVLLAPRADPTQVAGLVAGYDPDAVVDATGTVRPRRDGSRHDLHPDLALLMATSGSTGSPRLVRLAAGSLDANAAAIGEYLDIRPDDRAALTLPMHYCYGLSVINSNLAVGAALLLGDQSVTDPAFWTAFREHRGTSLHGVPYTFELLDRIGFAEMSLPHLRYVTQAGGRLAPDQVRRWAEAGVQQGWDLVVMYGQTEATARMAYLPPRLAVSAPEAIGVAIPGGSLTVEGADPDGVGELVHRGPNVMLGYAAGPADLALGRTTDALRTGDLGRVRADGLLEVVGRRSRFVKPFGVRVDLDGLERLLADHGIEAACTGTDDRIVVAARGPSGVVDGAVRAVLSARLPMPASALAIVPVDELPRRANGKLDHPAVAGLAPVDHPAGDPRPGPFARWARTRRPRPVREVFARTFPGRDLDDDATFVDLGGDSLTYVQVSADIERALGRLPHGWDTIPLGRLAAMTPQRSAVATIETVVLLRALAIVLVVGEHMHLWSLLGGAHLLLAVSGWTFARFALARRGGPDVTGERGGWALPRRILRSTALIAVPSSLWIAFRATTQNDVHYADALLAGGLLHPLVQGYWFVDALVQILLGTALLFAVPAARRLEQRHPFALPATLLALAQLLRLLPGSTTITPDLYSTHLVLWLFLLGWTAYRARTVAQLVAVTLATVVLLPTFFGTEVERAVLVAGGLLVLLLVPRVRLPRGLAVPVTAVASASLGIYLTHFALLPLLAHGVPSAVLVPAALALGVAAWWIAHDVVRWVATSLQRHGSAGVVDQRGSVTSTSPAARFSSRCTRLRVPGISRVRSWCASSHASPTCEGVAPSRRAVATTSG